MIDKKIVGIGEILWDVFGERKTLGGAPANFVYNIAQFGLDGLVVSAIGNDKMGSEIAQNLQEKKVESILATSNKRTGTVIVDVDNAGVPAYDITDNVAWDFIYMTPELKELAKRTQVVCFGSLAQRSMVTRTTINTFLDLMPSSPNSMKIFDVNLRQNYYSAEILNASLNKCNVLKVNDEELAVIVHYFGYDHLTTKKACKELVKMFNFKALILTCGMKGSYIFTPILTSFYDTPTVNVVDTVGAGDSFLAAFVAAILKGKSIADAHRFAVEMSAYVCTQEGGMVDIYQDLLDRI